MLKGSAMSKPTKLAAGSVFPSISLDLVGGGTVDVALMSGWRMLVVYRGRHCPLCKKYFKILDAMADEIKGLGVSVVAASADSVQKAEADISEYRWRFPLAYGLTLDQMKTLGLYISELRPGSKADGPFAEPGLFIVNPDGKLQIVEVSNAPFARADLNGILEGLRTITRGDYPIRGTF